jgi:hypothetical protein
VSPPDKRKPGLGTRADATTKTYRQPEAYLSPPHEVYLRYTLASRIRWLERHRHWWIRSIAEHQATCSSCRRCDGEVAA